MNQRRTTKIALSGIIIALCIIVMMLTFIGINTYAAPALAGILLAVIVIEIDMKWAFLAYIVVCLLSFLAPDKEALLLFILFFGYYPILKAKLETLQNRAVYTGLKILVFNIAMVLSYGMMMYIFGFPLNPLPMLGYFSYPIIFIVANLIFWLYDVAISRVISAYVNVLHPKLKKILKR